MFLSVLSVFVVNLKLNYQFYKMTAPNFIRFENIIVNANQVRTVEIKDDTRVEIEISDLYVDGTVHPRVIEAQCSNYDSAVEMVNNIYRQLKPVIKND